MFKLIAFCLVGFAVAAPAQAQDISEKSLFEAATSLATQYDQFYGAKNIDGMTKVYAPDAILLSPSGAVVKGTEALRTYYQKRFASGAKDHASTISEVHVQGNGGYAIGHFAVTVPTPNGGERREQGNLGVVYQLKDDGWHIQMLVPSAFPEK